MIMMLPLISLLILLLIILAFIAPLRKIRISLSKTNLLVGSYLVILLTSVPAFYAIAQPNMLEEGNMIEFGPGIYKFEDPQLNAFYDAFSQGQLNQHQHAELVAQWNFDYGEGHLKISAPGYEDNLPPIAVERKDTYDGKLEVLCYAPKFPNRLTLVNPPDIHLQANQLEIVPPERIHFKAAQFYHDFTMAQFTGMGTSFVRMDYSFNREVLYLRIPKDLLIDIDEGIEDSINLIKI